MINCYQRFFATYCSFASKDLIDFFDPAIGRNAKVIDFTFRTFFVLTHEKSTFEQKQKAVQKYENVIKNYLIQKNNNDDMQTIIKRKLVNYTESEFDVNFGHLNNIRGPFNYFSTARKDFNNLRINNKQNLKQGLIEFNNAMSHLFAGASSSNTSLEKNIKKANAHFYRGAMDYYKTIIKDNFLQLTKDQRSALAELRFIELDCVGLVISDTEEKRKDIFEQYQKIIQKFQPTAQNP